MSPVVDNDCGGVERNMGGMGVSYGQAASTPGRGCEAL
jgi:hypothetical protein